MAKNQRNRFCDECGEYYLRRHLIELHAYDSKLRTWIKFRRKVCTKCVSGDKIAQVVSGIMAYFGPASLKALPPPMRPPDREVEEQIRIWQQKLIKRRVVRAA